MSEDKIPEANFLNFLSGLGSQALMQLGEIPNPASNQRESNLSFARYSIELLRVLKDKTEGNRNEEEEQYLNTMLQDLSSRLEKLQQSSNED
jgi:hypothetical protein